MKVEIKKFENVVIIDGINRSSITIHQEVYEELAEVILHDCAKSVIVAFLTGRSHDMFDMKDADILSNGSMLEDAAETLLKNDYYHRSQDGIIDSISATVNAYI